MLHFNSLIRNSLAIKKAFITRTDTGGGGKAQALKWRRTAALSSHPHSVNFLSLNFPHKAQITLTYAPLYLR